MLPTLRPGEQVLVDPGRRRAPGDLVLARHPNQPDVTVVKRVIQIEADGRYVLASDNPDAGTDSRQWGPVPATAVLGCVTLVLDRPAASLTRSGTAAETAARPLSPGRWLRR
jgi:nickel-type superoxide dismutase maturation protease